MAVGYTSGDPQKVARAGDTMTGPLVLDDDPTADLEAATKQYVDDNIGGGAPTLVTVESAENAAGTITVPDSAHVQLAADLTIEAAAGDRLSIEVELLAFNTGADMVVDVATRVSGADVNWVSSRGPASRFPGGLPQWYVDVGFTGPRGSGWYPVQAGDVDGGSVTMRLYARAASGGSRDVFASATWPIRWRIINLGAPS